MTAVADSAVYDDVQPQQPQLPHGENGDDASHYLNHSTVLQLKPFQLQQGCDVDKTSRFLVLKN